MISAWRFSVERENVIGRRRVRRPFKRTHHMPSTGRKEGCSSWAYNLQTSNNHEWVSTLESSGVSPASLYALAQVAWRSVASRCAFEESRLVLNGVAFWIVCYCCCYCFWRYRMGQRERGRWRKAREYVVSSRADFVLECGPQQKQAAVGARPFNSSVVKRRFGSRNNSQSPFINYITSISTRSFCWTVLVYPQLYVSWCLSMFIIELILYGMRAFSAWFLAKEVEKVKKVCAKDWAPLVSSSEALSATNL